MEHGITSCFRTSLNSAVDRLVKDTLVSVVQCYDAGLPACKEPTSLDSNKMGFAKFLVQFFTKITGVDR